MNRLLAIALTCLLAACSSQHRVDPEPDFSNPDVAPDENPDEPRLGEIESLISQAKLEIKRRDYDEARVKLHQVFRRDRWHPEANTIYQDLRIQLKQGDALYQEYLDLYEANKTRGDALWFHLRPLLIKRGIKACEVEKHTELTEERLKQVGELESAAQQLSLTDEDKPKARRLLEEILSIDPMRGTAVERLAYLYGDEIVRKYREAAQENPVSGDAVYLYAMAVKGANPGSKGELASLDLLSKAWILELPGLWVPAGLADIAYAREYERISPASLPHIDLILDAGDGRLNLALNFYRVAELTRPSGGFGKRVRAVLELAGNRKLEDLSLRD